MIQPYEDLPFYFTGGQFFLFIDVPESGLPYVVSHQGAYMIADDMLVAVKPLEGVEAELNLLSLNDARQLVAAAGGAQ